MFKIHPMNEKQLPSYPLRMPPEVREQVEAAAKSSGRSMNAEIVARLQASFSDASAGTSFAVPVIASRLAHLAGQLHDLQNKRNTLAVMHLTISKFGDPEKTKGVLEEINSLDQQVALLVREIQSKAD